MFVDHMKMLRIRPWDLAFIIIVCILIGILVGVNSVPQIGLISINKTYANFTWISDSKTVRMNVPAVDTEGNGVLSELITTVSPARNPDNGMVFVSINDVLAQYDTQFSARKAAGVAEAYTSIDLGNIDVSYTFKINATAIEGPSAGAAMAVSVIAALQNKTIRNDVMITGSIQEDGSIGMAGAIAEKALVSDEIEIFLVPEGQSPKEYTRERDCRIVNGYEYCETDYVEKYTEINLTIIEVSNIEEALQYFLAD